MPSSRDVGGSTGFTTVAPASITEPDQATNSDPLQTDDVDVSSTYSPPSENQATIDGWVAHFSNGAAFLGWTVTGTTVSGTYSYSYLPPGATTLTSDSASFSGSIDGTSVTLTFSHGFGSTVSGQITNDTLSLSIPQSDGTIQVSTYHPGTTADYNADVQIAQASAAELQAESASNASIASQASASSAAAAAVQRLIQDDQDTEHSAITSLTQDANFDSELSSIAQDVKQAATDLAQTRADAKDGGGDNCTNASTTVYNDAATTVYNDAQTSLANDVDSLTRDIATAQKDIADVQAADQQLGTDGVEAAAEAATSISAAKSAITAATTAADADIDKVNNALATAYTIANGIATGPCDGMGPGEPPTPVPHI